MKVNLLVCISFEVHRIFPRRTYENSQMMRKNIAENPIYVGNFCDVRITATSCCHALTTISVWQIKPLYIFNEIISWLLNIFSTIFFPSRINFRLNSVWTRNLCVSQIASNSMVFLFVFFFFLAINELLTANAFISVSAFSLQAKICAANILHENRKAALDTK